MSDESRWGELRSALHSNPINYQGIHLALEHFWDDDRRNFLEAFDYAREIMEGRESVLQPPQYIPVQQWYLGYLLPLLKSVHQDKSLTRAYKALSLFNPWCPILKSLDTSMLCEDEQGMICIPRKYFKTHSLPKHQHNPNQYTSQKLGHLALPATTQHIQREERGLQYKHAWLVDPNQWHGKEFEPKNSVVWELDSLLECVLHDLFRDFVPARGEWNEESDLRHYDTELKLGWHQVRNRDDIEGLELNWIYEQLGIEDLMKLTKHVPTQEWMLWGFLCDKHAENPYSNSRVHVLVDEQHLWAFWDSDSRFWG